MLYLLIADIYLLGNCVVLLFSKNIKLFCHSLQARINFIQYVIRNSTMFRIWLSISLIFIFKLEINTIFGCLWCRIGHGKVFHSNGIFQNYINAICVFQENIFHVTFAITSYKELRIPDSRISINKTVGIRSAS